MRRLNLGQRIGSVGCLILVTVAVALFYFIAKGFSKDIEVATLEQEGNQYQTVLEQLLEALPEHQLLARQIVSGHPDLQPRSAEVERTIDASMAALQAVDAKLGADLQFTDEGLAKQKREHFRWQTLKSEWEALKNSAPQSVADSDKLHEHLAADVRTMIAHAGDTSNLILDSDLDSYYLVDVTLATLPQTQDRLASIEKLGQDAIIDGKFSDEHRIELAVDAALLNEGDVQRIQGDAQTTLNEDQNFHGVSKSLQQNLPPALDAYSKANQALIDLMQKIVAAPGASVSAAEFSATVEAARRSSFDLWKTGAQELNTLLQMRIDDLSHTRFWALVWTSMGLAEAFGMAFFIMRRSLKELGKIASELSDSAEEVHLASTHISASSHSLSAGSSASAASIQETSASSEEINSMARKNLDTSNTMATLMSESKAMLVQTNRHLEEAVESMGEISQSSSKISKIIKTIDEIAFQTNILALNAAVEAARAGDAGMGFAVVAEEVRNLAHRSAQAAKDTEALIQDSIAKSDSGKARVDQVAVAIRAMTEGSANISMLVDAVSLGSEEQSRGVTQIAGAIGHIEQITQASAANAEENAAAAEELNAQSDGLKSLVARLNTTVGGYASAGRHM